MDITINICKTHGNNCDGRCIDPNGIRNDDKSMYPPGGCFFTV